MNIDSRGSEVGGNATMEIDSRENEVGGNATVDMESTKVVLVGNFLNGIESAESEIVGNTTMEFELAKSELVVSKTVDIESSSSDSECHGVEETVISDFIHSIKEEPVVNVLEGRCDDVAGVLSSFTSEQIKATVICNVRQETTVPASQFEGESSEIQSVFKSMAYVWNEEESGHNLRDSGRDSSIRGCGQNNGQRITNSCVEDESSNSLLEEFRYVDSDATEIQILSPSCCPVATHDCLTDTRDRSIKVEMACIVPEDEWGESVNSAILVCDIQHSDSIRGGSGNATNIADVQRHCSRLRKTFQFGKLSCLSDSSDIRSYLSSCSNPERNPNLKKGLGRGSRAGTCIKQSDTACSKRGNTNKRSSSPGKFLDKINNGFGSTSKVAGNIGKKREGKNQIPNSMGEIVGERRRKSRKNRKYAGRSNDKIIFKKPNQQSNACATPDNISKVAGYWCKRPVKRLVSESSNADNTYKLVDNKRKMSGSIDTRIDNTSKIRINTGKLPDTTGETAVEYKGADSSRIQNPDKATCSRSDAQKSPTAGTRSDSGTQKSPATGTRSDTGTQKSPATGTNSDTGTQKSPATGTRSDTGRQKSQSGTCRMIATSMVSMSGRSKAHSSEKAYKCNTCGRTFLHKSVLVRHTKVHMHAEHIECKCDICHRVCSRKTDLTRHTRIHDVGGKRFCQRSKLDVHVNVCTSDKVCKCNALCSKTCSCKLGPTRPKMLRTGVQSHKCEECDKTCSCKLGPTRPKMLRTGVQSHKCEECDKTFCRRSQLDIHVKMHTGDRPFKCKLCDKAFTCNSYLTRHMMSHLADKPHKCDSCEKTFSQRTRLLSHTRIMHSDERPHKCDICDKAYSEKHDLNRHIRSHIGHQPYQCDKCGKTFRQLSALTSHAHTHTGHKPYVCDACGKGFSTGSQLKTHTRIHTGAKPYQCTECEKTFRQISQLRQHTITHTDLKPFGCQACGKRYTRKENLINHTKLHFGSKTVRQ